MCRLQSIVAQFQPIDVELLGCFAEMKYERGSDADSGARFVFRSCKRRGEGEVRREGETERTH